MDNLAMSLIWLAVIIAAAVIEALTAELVSIWFVVGGAAGLIAALCGADITLQLCLFFGLTLLALLCTRPLVKRAARFEKTRTGADRYVGEQGEVTEEINNLTGTGQVVVLGSVWTARSADGSIILKDSFVTIDRIEGVRLIVSKL